MGSLAKKASTDHGPMNETEWGLHGASTEIEIFREVEQDEKVIDRIAAAQREELGQEIAGLQAGARARETAIGELVGTSSI
jgi:hypothetical protein